jgi:hypothetical protein
MHPSAQFKNDECAECTAFSGQNVTGIMGHMSLNSENVAELREMSRLNSREENLIVRPLSTTQPADYDILKVFGGLRLE